MKAAVPMVGIPSFARRWLDLLDECSFSNPAWAEALRSVEPQARQHTAFIQQMDPYEKLKSAAPRALLIMNNDFDSDQPKHYSIQCYRELLPYYASSPENLRLSIFPAAHTVTPDMEAQAVEWFVEKL
ncbi:MAG: hypothetical protein EHM70_22870 [Chloroflexota bacterium]|nr:MAG: hypothetical protein EHM70_22870 [Chloroflexota bacterium]